MQTPASNGERFALAEKDLWYKDVAKLLRENGFEKAPTIGIPVWLAKIMANFSKELKLHFALSWQIKKRISIPLKQKIF